MSKMFHQQRQSVVQKMIFNPDHDTDVFCVWCKEKFVLVKKEVWDKPYICPICHKLMGKPVINHGHRRTPFPEGDLKEYWDARYYHFVVYVPKTKVLAFIAELHVGKHGCCLSVDPQLIIYGDKPMSSKTPWMLLVEINSGFEFEGARWELPPMLHAV